MRLQNKIIAVEGTDGSGKSTIASFIVEQLKTRGIRCEVITKNFNDSISACTDSISAINLNGDEIDKKSFLHARIARDYQKAKISKNLSNSTFVIIDRFVLSSSAMADAIALNYENYYKVFVDIVETSGLHGTILCNSDFDVAQSRLLNRTENENLPLSRKEAMGYDYNKKIHLALIERFNDTNLARKKYDIKTDDTLAYSKLQAQEVINDLLSVS